MGIVSGIVYRAACMHNINYACKMMISYAEYGKIIDIFLKKYNTLLSLAITGGDYSWI